jgi:hypothetical protein
MYAKIEPRVVFFKNERFQTDKNVPLTMMVQILKLITIRIRKPAGKFRSEASCRLYLRMLTYQLFPEVFSKTKEAAIWRALDAIKKDPRGSLMVPTTPLNK